MKNVILPHGPGVRDVIETVFREGIEYIRLYFPDPLGRLKGQNVSVGEIWDILEEGQGFDGSSIEGFVRIEESDKVAFPIPSTFRILPYPVNNQRIGVMLCEVRNPEGSRFAGDSLWVLERAVEEARRMGFDHYYVGPEIEYFYLGSEMRQGTIKLIHEGGYFDEGTTHTGAVARMQAVEAFAKLLIKVEGDHGEVADSQNEIDLKYQDAIVMAYYAMLYRVVVKELAGQMGFFASFMPKPIAGVNGSGMHVHQSLFSGGQNAFFDGRDEYHLSDTARQYMAGIFKYLDEAMIILCQWVNSYKRLIPGYEAPVYKVWGRRNRSALIRVPEYKPGKENATRIELRCADPGCNPALAFAVMLRMGLQGIKEHLTDLPSPVEDDVFHLSEKVRKHRGIRSLPGSFQEALEEFKRSSFMKQVLGDHLFGKIISSKEKEWDEYVAAVGKKNAKNRLKVFPGEVKYYSQWL